MHSQPLTSGDQGKLLIFALLLAPSVVFFVGVVPTIFLVFGLIMMKRNRDFSSVETAARNVKGYTLLALVGCLIGSAYFGHKYFTIEDRWRSDEEAFVFFIFFTGVCVAYWLAVHYLFLVPLRDHREWVVKNGIFTTAQAISPAQAAPVDIDIIKGERLKNYSVADELLKWARLKEDGHISEQEFNEARAKLLRKA